MSRLTQFDRNEASTAHSPGHERATTSAALERGLSGGRAWQVAALAIAGLAAIPLIAVAISAPSGGLRGLSQLADTIVWRYIGNTAMLMAATGALASFMGVASAWFVSACRFPGRAIFSWALVLPLAVPSYIAAYIYADLLDFSGPVQSGLRALTGWGVNDYTFPSIRSLWGGAVILALVLYPYIYLLARAAFATQSRTQFRAARTLGASSPRAFRQVALPAARPAIAGGLALVLMEVLADFGVAEYFAIPTFSTGIFRSWLAMGDKEAAMGLAALMLCFVAALVALEALTRKGRSASRDGLADAPLDEPLVVLSPLAQIGALAVCCLPVILGFGVPAAYLAILAMEPAAINAAAALAQYASASIWLGAIVALATTGFALTLAFAKSRSDGRLVPTLSRIATLGYALPGALLAVGLLAPLGAFDLTITRLARDAFGYTGGLLLTGTSLVLIYALCVRFLTVAYNTIEGGMARIPSSLDAAARTLGATPTQALTRIYIPLLRPSLLAALALVLIDTLRELPATLILRPFNLETLATRTYRLASDERLVEASIPALILLAVGLIPVMMLTRGKAR